MKVKRQKTVRRILLFYRNNFNLTPPYHILVDGTFCKAALNFKINISEQLPKYLDAEVKIHTTRCVIAECELFGKMLYGPLKILRQFSIIDCSHETPQSPVKCLKRMVRGKKRSERFFIATQDPVLSEKTRKMAGVPLLYISHNAINLESPSPAEQLAASQRLNSNLRPSASEQASLATLKEKILGITEGPEPAKKKRRKIKGPNPLSCKPKQKKEKESSGLQVNNQGQSGENDTSGEVKEKKKRSRHRRKKMNKEIRNIQ